MAKINSLFALMLLVVFMAMGKDVSAKSKKDDSPIFKTDTLFINLDTTYSDNPYRTFYIEYKNVGKRDLIIEKIEASCHCTTVEFDSISLRKNKKGELKVSVDMGMFRYGKYYRDIFVYTNASEDPVEIRFTGYYLRKEND